MLQAIAKLGKEMKAVMLLRDLGKGTRLSYMMIGIFCKSVSIHLIRVFQWLYC